MRKRYRLRALLTAVAFLTAVLVPASAWAQPRNVILMIGDGMGFEHVKAGSLYGYGKEGKLFMEQLPTTGSLSTHPAGGGGPDSANTGTALATGVKVRPGVISLRLPGNGEKLPTILERYAEDGKSTGLVTSESLGGPTPAVFAAHVKSRKMYADIYKWYYEKTRPNLLMGGGWQHPPDQAEKAGYHVITTRREMLDLDPGKTPHVLGRFSPTDMPYEYDYARRIDSRYDRWPHLSEMTAAAVKFLSANKKGFFLMVEGGIIDHASHQNDLQRTVMQVLEFDNAVKETMRWAIDRNDTLVVVTADHECGGLRVTKGNGRGQWPDAKFTTGGHTKDDVPLYAWGVGAEKLSGKLDNTDVPKRILELPATAEVDAKKLKWALTVSY